MISVAKLSFEFLINTFDSIPEAVVIADVDRKILSVNAAFTGIFGFSKQEALDQSTTFIYASRSEFERAGNSVFHAGSNVNAKIYKLAYARKNGSQFIGETVASEVKNKDGITIGFLGIIRDLTNERRRTNELANLTKRLHTLVEITTLDENDFDAQIERILRQSTDLLELEVGIVSHIENEIYTVKHFYPESSGLFKEQNFRLGNTYCDLTFKADEVVAIDHMQTSQYQTHPCYKQFELETYIGASLIADGVKMGTLNFSSSVARQTPFTEADKDLVMLISTWIGALLQRKHIKEELEKSREMYRIISERASDVVGLHFADGTLEYVSPSIESILGYQQEEVLASVPLELIHPVDRAKIGDAFKNPPQNEKKATEVVFQIKKKTGEFIWFETTFEFLFGKQRQVIAVKSYSREITEMKRLDKIYSQVGAMAEIGGWEHNLETGEIFWTDQMFKIFDVNEPVSLLTDFGLAFFPGEKAKQKVKKAIASILELGTSRTLEVPFTSRLGRHKFVRIKIIAQLENKQVKKLNGIVQDITIKKREENLFKDTQGMARVGGWEYDLSSNNLYWTDEVYRIHDLDPSEELDVEGGIDFYDEEDGSREKISGCIQEAIQTGKGWDEILTIFSAIGAKKTVRAIGKTIIRNGEVVKLTGTFQDVSVEKEKELELERKNNELTELNTMSHQMNSIIGHDLKSPLSSIIGLSDFTLYSLNSGAAEIDVDEIRTNLKMMYVASRQMAELLDDVFKWSRLQIVGIELNLEAFRLNSVIESTFEILDLVASQKNIEFVNVCSNEIEVVADRTLCPTVIRNFISNAIKFSQEWGTVTVSCEQTKNYWSVSVKDEGVGMAEEVKNNLFHATKHPSKRGTKNEKGTGIGLRLCQKLAHLHNGEILVESEQGKGSTFTFKVPILQPTV